MGSSAESKWICFSKASPSLLSLMELDQLQLAKLPVTETVSAGCVLSEQVSVVTGLNDEEHGVLEDSARLPTKEIGPHSYLG